MRTCSTLGCETGLYSRGLCRPHYQKLKRAAETAICCIKECRKKVVARDMCATHYQRLKKYGSPMRTQVRQFHGLSVKDRLFKWVEKTDECWLWKGTINPTGYGLISIDSRPRLAHRVSWTVHNGEIPDGLFVLHRCDTPLCVRPDHLFLGTQNDNMADMWTKGRANPGHVVGRRVGTAKLTEVQVRSIRQSNMPGVFLATKYGVSTTQISDIRNRKSWRHLDDRPPKERTQ